MRRDGKCSALPAGVGRVAIGKGVMPVHFSGYHSMCRRRSIIQKSQEPEGSSILEMQTSEHQHGRWLKSGLDYVSRWRDESSWLQFGCEGVELRMRTWVCRSSESGEANFDIRTVN
jgi:hypothetical protein